jgi:hypothetical protein
MDPEHLRLEMTRIQQPDWQEDGFSSSSCHMTAGKEGNGMPSHTYIYILQVQIPKTEILNFLHSDRYLIYALP